MLKIKNITKVYEVDSQKLKVFEGVTFDIVDGSFNCIIGPSGCGKSTLIRIISKLEPMTSGEVEWDEDPNIGFVFQNYALFPYMTVFENIAFGLKMRGEKRETIIKRTAELIDEMGLTGFEDKHPKELSGGMRQRVGIARALAVDPNILILDEPFSSLDEFTAENLRKNLLKIWATRKITVLMVTHLVREALELADNIIVMSKSPSTATKIVKNELKRPRNLRSKEFFAKEDEITSMINQK